MLSYNDEVNRQYEAITDLCREPIMKALGGASSDVCGLIFEYLMPVKRLFGLQIPSVMTVQGMLSNTVFEESDLIHALDAKGRVQAIVCNYGEIYNPDYKEISTEKKKTNRGRKRKEKKKNKRKNQGTGKRFNSQISFWVASDVKVGKLYKIKVFRNGRLEIPGGLEPDMRDVISAVQVVEAEMEHCLCEGIKLIELYSIMRNYKFKTINPDARINIRRLFEIFIKAREEESDDVKSLNEIKYNVERYPGLIVKFSTPIPRNMKKKTTIKMFNSGKVNIYGAVSELSAEFYYRWINEFYAKHEDEIVYIPKSDESDDDSDSNDPTDGYMTDESDV